MLHVLIVDDVRLYLEGLAAILQAQSQIERVEIAADLTTALQHIVISSPDVVLLNTAMTGSTDVLRTITETAQETPVIALGVSESEDEVIAWAEAGIKGYLFRAESLTHLIAAIQSVAHGETLCPPRITATLLRRIASLASQPRAGVEADRLTPRERQILALIDEGLSNKEISRRLTIEVRTVKNHVHNILEKLQVQRRGQAAAKLRRPTVDLRPGIAGNKPVRNGL
jgi:two-component system, NarL family, nitrate/nitrite response regulator NarL